MKDIFDDIPLSSAMEGNDDILSMAEYEELRLMLVSARAAFASEDQDIKPDPDIQRILRTKVAARKKRFDMPVWPSIHFSSILKFPVPAYQFATAVVLILLVNLFVIRNSDLKSPSGAAAYRTDTAWLNQTNKASHTFLAVDSEKRTISPAISGAIYADSVDINGPEPYNGADKFTTPAGEFMFPGQVGPKDSNSINLAPILTVPSKKIGTHFDDSSRWGQRLRG